LIRLFTEQIPAFFVFENLKLKKIRTLPTKQLNISEPEESQRDSENQTCVSLPIFSKKGAKGDQCHQTMGKTSNHLLFQLDVKKSEIRDGITGAKNPEINSRTLHLLSRF